MSEEYKVCCPKDYFSHFFAQKIRPDGRKFYETREVKLEKGILSSCDGSSIVTIGQTTVYCGIKGELTLVADSLHEREFVNINFDFSPASQCDFKFGTPSEASQQITAHLNEIYKASPLIDQNKLIVNEKIRWVLFVDILCCVSSGSIIDASVIALNSAFNDLKLPVAVIKEDVEVYEDKFWKPEISNNFPVCLSFISFNCEWISDPTDFEETISEGSGFVALNGDRIVLMKLSRYSPPLSTEEISSLIEKASKHMHKLIDKIK